jgi:hydrogenase maturation factor
MNEECVDEVCLTCGDVAVPAVIVSIEQDDLATVRTVRNLPDHKTDQITDHITEQISVALVDAGPGDTVLVHAGEAIGVVEPVRTEVDV